MHDPKTSDPLIGAKGPANGPAPEGGKLAEQTGGPDRNVDQRHRSPGLARVALSWLRPILNAIRSRVTTSGLGLFFSFVGALSTACIAALTYYALFYQVIPKFQLDKANENLAVAEVKLTAKQGELEQTILQLKDAEEKLSDTKANLYDFEKTTQMLAVRHFIYLVRIRLPLSRDAAELLSSIDEDPSVDVQIVRTDRDKMVVLVSRGLQSYPVSLLNQQTVRTSTRTGRQLVQNTYKAVASSLPEKHAAAVEDLADRILSENKPVFAGAIEFSPIREFNIEQAKEEIKRTAIVNVRIHEILDAMGR